MSWLFFKVSRYQGVASKAINVLFKIGVSQLSLVAYFQILYVSSSFVYFFQTYSERIEVRVCQAQSRFKLLILMATCSYLTVTFPHPGPHFFHVFPYFLLMFLFSRKVMAVFG